MVKLKVDTKMMDGFNILCILFVKLCLFAEKLDFNLRAKGFVMHYTF